MKIGVPKETAAGERRVALIPDAVESLAEHESTSWSSPAPARGRGIRTPSTRRPAPTWVGGGCWRRRGRRPRRRPDGRARSAGSSAGSGPDRPPRAADLGRDEQGARGGRRDQLRDGGDPADHPRAGDGRAVLAGERRRLRRDPARRARGRPLLPDDDHRRRHRRPGEGAGPRRRRRRPAGDRDRERLGAVVTGFDIRRAAWEQIASLGGRPLDSTSSPTPRPRAATRGR